MSYSIGQDSRRLLKNSCDWRCSVYPRIFFSGDPNFSWETPPPFPTCNSDGAIVSQRSHPTLLVQSWVHGPDLAKHKTLFPWPVWLFWRWARNLHRANSVFPVFCLLVYSFVWSSKRGRESLIFWPTGGKDRNEGTKGHPPLHRQKETAYRKNEIKERI